MILRQDYKKVMENKEAEFTDKLIELGRLFEIKDEKVLQDNADFTKKGV